jgi:23S rRNA pseudouridine2605 synthase
MVTEGKQRLQKLLAAAGYGSRRACEALIRQGRVTVNGREAQIGDTADPAHDAIRVDGSPVRIKPTHTYIALYKPTGVISTLSDELGRKTVRDLVPVEGHLVPAGRLDADSEGLVLLTDDGELANLLTHPRYQATKEYHVLVTGRPSEATLSRWRRGVDLPDFNEKARDGGRTAPAQVDIMRHEDGSLSAKDGTWLRVVMHEGRKRQIRRVAELLGHPVRRLLRVRIGSLHIGALKPGQWRRLTEREVKELRASA